MSPTVSQPPRSTDASTASDFDFLVAFESCSLPADAFPHYAHVRLAWIYLRGAPVDEATQLMAAGIRRFAIHHTGSSAKYNEALTRAWVRLVAHARAMSPNASTFAAFAELHPMLFDRKRAFEFYGVEAP